MFVEAFGEIRRRVEAHQEAYFVHPVLSGTQQLGTFVQPNQFDVVVRGQSGNAFYLFLKICSADGKLTGEAVYGKVFI